MADHENKSTSKPRLENKLAGIFAVAIVAGVLAIVIYLFKVEIGLPGDPERWGQFGDYLGGVLNPFFALLGLIALLLTIILQSRELEYTREELRNSSVALEGSRQIADQQKELISTQDQKEDIFRVINFIYEDLNKTLEEKIRIRTADSILDVSVANLFGKYKNPSHEFTTLNPHPDIKNNWDFKKNLSILKNVEEKFIELAFYLERFDQLSGQTLLTDFYRERLIYIIRDLNKGRFIGMELVDMFKAKNPAAPSNRNLN